MNTYCLSMIYIVCTSWKIKLLLILKIIILIILINARLYENQSFFLYFGHSKSELQWRFFEDTGGGPLILDPCCQALCPFLCLCVCVSKSLRKWTQTDTKVTFHPPTPPENFFWSQMKGMAKIRLFYSGDMALILPR